jgi:hypothetical protein
VIQNISRDKDKMESKPEVDQPKRRITSERVLILAVRAMLNEGDLDRGTLRNRVEDATFNVLSVGNPGTRIEDFADDTARAEQLAERVMDRVHGQRRRR